MIRFISALCIMMVDLIPLATALLILWPTKHAPAKGWHRGTIAVFCVCMHTACCILLQKLFFGSWEFLYAFRCVYRFDFTSRDLDFFAVSLSLRSIAAGTAGFLMSFFFSKIYARKVRPMRMSRKGTAMLYFLISIAVITVSGALYCSYSATQNIIITEVGSNNTQFLPDSDNTVCDYIELHNPGSFPCAAEQLYLSDDASDLHKKEIPETIIPAHGFLLVALDDQSFQIDKHGGETIFLSDTRGHVLDQVTMVALEPDFSYCRVADTSENWDICSTTPGITNKEGGSRLDAAPRLSHSSGFYKEAFDLQITAQDGVTIYYTLDGSIPTTESEIYTRPIRVYNRSAEPNVWLNQQQVTQEWEAYTPDPTPVDKAFIIRAIGVDADGAVSKPVCATYFIGLEKYIGYNVVSLIVDPDDFWGEDGIYITGSEYDQWYRGDRTEEAPLPHFFKRGRLWERPAYFCYLSGDRVFEQDIGIRISGASARNKPKKRFSLFAREEYSGSDVFTENIFPDTQSKRLSLRSGFAGAFCQLLAPDRSFGIQRSEYVFLFLNGELWDIYSIMEKYDDLYFYEHYGVNPNNVVVMKGGILEEGIPGDELLLNEIYDYLAVHDLSDRDNYEAFSEILDIQSYIDYMCFNIYIDNLDFTEQKNAVWWRSREVTPKPFEDGKWRFLLYDLDAMAWDDPWLWGIDTKAEKNSFSLIPSFTDNQAINQQPIFAALAKNPEFRKRFVLTFMDLVNMHFRYETVQLALDAYTQRMELEDSGFYYTFFRDRAKYIVPYLAEEFALGGTPEPLHLAFEIHTTKEGALIQNLMRMDDVHSASLVEHDGEVTI